MKRLIEKIVFCGLVTACRFATWPTSRSPSFVNATTDGVTRPPSEFGMTTGSPPSMTATTELVVPRSIPITFSAIASLELCVKAWAKKPWLSLYHMLNSAHARMVQAIGVPQNSATLAGWQRVQHLIYVTKADLGLRPTSAERAFPA